MNEFQRRRMNRFGNHRIRRTNEDFKRLLNRNGEEKDQELLIPQTDSNDKVREFMQKIFMSRDIMNVYHYNVKGEPGSKAMHEACGEYYDEILSLFDDFRETYMGEYGFIEGYDLIEKAPFNIDEKSPIDYLTELADYIKYARFAFEDSHLQNMIDEIMTLIYHILYKMKYTK